MSSSSRTLGPEGSKLELPVFVLPNELIFSPSKRRTLLTVYNPYGSEAHFRIMSTSPDRFDISSTKGIIKPNRRIDITIRLLSQAVNELPEPTDEPQTVDYFKVSTQVGALKGNKAIIVYWSMTAVEFVDGDEAHPNQLDDRSSKLRLRAHKQAMSLLGDGEQPPGSSQRLYPNQRQLAGSNVGRSRSQLDHNNVAPSGSNINLICFLCAIGCVIFLYLPIALDSELCKKAKVMADPADGQASWLAQLGYLLSVSYEMKLGCSFALGLFTYRLISTLPN